jgi:hypothetical protein
MFAYFSVFWKALLNDLVGRDGFLLSDMLYFFGLQQDLFDGVLIFLEASFSILKSVSPVTSARTYYFMTRTYVRTFEFISPSGREFLVWTIDGRQEEYR